MTRGCRDKQQLGLKRQVSFPNVTKIQPKSIWGMFLKNNSILRSYFNLNRFQEIGCNYTLHLFTSINIVYLSNFRSQIKAQFCLLSMVVTRVQTLLMSWFYLQKSKNKKATTALPLHRLAVEKLTALQSTLGSARRFSHVSILLLHFLLNK